MKSATEVPDQILVLESAWLTAGSPRSRVDRFVNTSQHLAPPSPALGAGRRDLVKRQEPPCKLHLASAPPTRSGQSCWRAPRIQPAQACARVTASPRSCLDYCSRGRPPHQIQALDRTQPGLPMKRGKCATFTHDYKRNGTTTLFAALSVLEGKVIGRCVPRHRHQEFIGFIVTVERSVPPGKIIHAILDNYAATSIPRCWPGSRRIRDGHSTSRRPLAHGSTPSKASSLGSPGRA